MKPDPRFLSQPKTFWANVRKISEQAGSIISSRKTTWTGRRTSGHLKRTGMRDIPMMGMCTEKM